MKYYLYRLVKKLIYLIYYYCKKIVIKTEIKLFNIKPTLNKDNQIISLKKRIWQKNIKARKE